MEIVQRSWDDDAAPPDGVYEGQFGGYEESPSGDENDLTTLLLVDPESGEGTDAVVGSVVLPTDAVPRLDGSAVHGGVAFHVQIEDGALTALHFDKERTKALRARVRGTAARIDELVD